MAKAEAAIQRAILDFLEALQICHWRVNLGGVRRSGIGRTRNPMAGFPDIGVIVRGRFLGIEVKTPAGRMEATQRDWKKRLEDAEATYIIATSVSDVRLALERMGGAS